MSHSAPHMQAVHAAHQAAQAQHQLPSPAPSPYPADGADPETVRADLEAQLLRLSQDLYEMEVCAGEVGPGMEEAVPNYLSKINTAFVNLSNLAPQVTDSVPRNVVDNVDRYKNPHQYTKTTLSRATGENQYALGRVLGLESFRRQLNSAMSEAFPTVPLPERRHQPVGEIKEDGAGEGEAASGEGVGAVGTVAAAGDAQPVQSGPPAGLASGSGSGEQAISGDNTERAGDTDGGAAHANGNAGPL